MTYLPWTHAEEEALRQLAHLGARELALAFDRPMDSIKMKARRIGVSLRRRKNAPDLTLSCDATLRRVREATRAALCPACARRPMSVKNTGLCWACHLEALKAVHEEEIARADAQLELWAARSMLLRRRKKLASLRQVGNGAESALKGDTRHRPDP